MPHTHTLKKRTLRQQLTVASQAAGARAEDNKRAGKGQQQAQLALFLPGPDPAMLR